MMGRTLYIGATTPQVKSAFSSGLMTAAELDPEPFSKAALAAVAVLLSFFKFGYDPKKLNDTALTEALIIGFNQAWEQITGEHLPYNCTPGQCGKQHVAIFTRSQWPNVPNPGGIPGVDFNGIIAAFSQAIEQGRAQLQRPQSAADYEANANYVMTLLQQAQQRAADDAAAASPVSALTDLFSGSGGAGKLLPWVLGGLAVYQFVL